MRRSPQKYPRKEIEKIVIFVDGETEIWYFNSLKKYLLDARKFDIKPELPKKKSLSGTKEEVLYLAKNYDKVYWLVDLDKIIQENKKETFRRIYNSLIRRKNITILINNPCFEFWILLHFRQTTKEFSNCSSVEKDLRKYIKNYSKDRKFYLNSQNDIFKRLYPNLKKAINNAKLIGKFDFDNFNSSKVEIYKIFEDNHILKLIKNL